MSLPSGDLVPGSFAALTAIAIFVACGGSSFESGGGTSGQGGATGSGGNGAGGSATGGKGGSTGGKGGAGGGAGGVAGTGTAGGSGSAGADAGPTPCLASNGCAGNEFCDFEQVPCGTGAHAGECRPRPTSCDSVYAPVCGCDGNVYTNECEANGSGVDRAGDTTICGQCPEAEPAPSAGCSQEGLRCTYGESPLPDCRTRATCTGGAWSVESADCKNAMNCASFPPSSGAACDPEGNRCTYTDTACVCTSCGGAGPCIPPPKWRCIGPPMAPCPALPPNDGAPCTDLGRGCSYGSCATGLSIKAQCKPPGAWLWEYLACPL